MSSPTLPDLLSTQGVTAGLIFRFWDNVKKLGQANLTQPVLQTRLTTLEEYWKQFLARHFEIMRREGADKSEYVMKDKFAEVEECYLNHLARFAERLAVTSSGDQNFAPTAGTSATNADPSVIYQQMQLPKISLPTFDGDLLAWENFRDLFRSMVHDVPGIPDVQKLQHLQRSLTGEAADMLRNIPITGVEYAGAWSDLLQRYDNPRVLLCTHMKNLLSCPEVHSTSSAEIKRLLGVGNRAFRSFKSLGRPVETWDDWLVHVLVQRLDPTTRMLWETSLSDSREFPTFDQLNKFLENRVRALDAADAAEGRPRAITRREPAPRHTRTTVHVMATPRDTKGPSCPLCTGSHSLGYCHRFKKMTPSNRREQARQLDVCLNCLRSGHSAARCPSEGRCLVCCQQHHTLLHGAATAGGQLTLKQGDSTSSGAEWREESADPDGSTRSTSGSRTLLSTAQVQLEGPEGCMISVRALLDSGAESSFVSEWVSQALRPRRRRVHKHIVGAQNIPTGLATSEVDLILKGRLVPERRLPLRALVLRCLSDSSPSQRVTLKESWTHLRDLDLADPAFGKPGRIDAILGTDILGLVLQPGFRPGSLESPSAKKTIFGWVLFGPTRPLDDPSCLDAVTTLWCRDCEQIDTTLRKFWEVEETDDRTVLTAEEEECEAHFRNTHSRDASGRYTVRLPFRPDARELLAPCRQTAVRVLLQQEHRARRTEGQGTKYREFMAEYLELHHMEPVPAEALPFPETYYLPHHAVTKANDPQGKIRVVFNASAKTATGYSLNDLLLPGPKLQSELWLILLRWRLFRVAFTSDVKKMFRQIRIHPDDADWQRIVWRDNPADKLVDYRLTTVTYGTVSAPFLALRTLRQLIIDDGDRFPLGARALKHNSYVDDILTGGDTKEQALEVRHQLTGLLGAGCFELGKWASNEPDLVPAEQPGEKMFDLNEGAQTLGVLWTPYSDSFHLRLRLSPEAAPPTKRTMLSTIARLYDPLGWVAPVLIAGKILLQNLWLQGLDWDQPLPNGLQDAWSRFHEALRNLEEISIPRWVRTNTENSGSTSIHGFCDASDRAYAAALYLRVTDPNGGAHTTLLAAKTKVAPVKTLSIPRLELCGALLLARLIATVKRELQLNFPVYAWTDSTVTLAWIRAHASRWKPFVANRVSDIQNSIPASSWGHVKTDCNPADAATRGMSATDLLRHDLWWHGPLWLSKPPSEWPTPPELHPNTGTDEERSQVALLTVAARPEDEILDRFSTLSRLLRVTALCTRFAYNASHPDQRRVGFIEAGELSLALRHWIRRVQLRCFEEDIPSLKSGKSLAAGSKLRGLRAFIDEQGLLRVGGRLGGAFLPYGERHPLILPGNSHLSLLLAREAHQSTLHGGPQLTRSQLQRRYWILRGGNLVRAVTRQCVVCARHRAQTNTQAMGQLPDYRVTPARPFLSTGVDYAGPIQLRLSRGRGTRSYKGYICVFVCLVTKAVHLEPVSDLTSAAFLAAFKRFTSRRGHCSTLMSDNGTCFRGADNELRAMFRSASDFYTSTSQVLALDGVSWRFIPPYAPHFGGLWEAGVKSVKHHLRRVVGEQRLTFEELSTLLCKIEACLNSRPLSPLSDNAEDLVALTPGHFLIGEPLTSVPEPNLEQERLHTLSNWQLLSNMRDHFWRRWRKEYLHHLQSLTKWRTVKDNLREGELVLLKDDGVPPAKWPMGRITNLHRGTDGLVRVVDIKTAKGTTKRPIVKICPLPVSA